MSAERREVDPRPFVQKPFYIPVNEDDTAWKNEGICTPDQTDLFLSSDRDDVKAAKIICSGCVVRETCLVYALRFDKKVGVWGGKSEGERRKMRRRNISLGVVD